MKSIVRSFIKNINYKHIKKYIGRNYMHCKKLLKGRSFLGLPFINGNSRDYAISATTWTK